MPTRVFQDHNYEFVIFLPQESVPFEKFREEFTGEKLRELLKYAYNDNSGVNVGAQLMFFFLESNLTSNFEEVLYINAMPVKL